MEDEEKKEDLNPGDDAPRHEPAVHKEDSPGTSVPAQDVSSDEPQPDSAEVLKSILKKTEEEMSQDGPSASKGSPESEEGGKPESQEETDTKKQTEQEPQEERTEVPQEGPLDERPTGLQEEKRETQSPLENEEEPLGDFQDAEAVQKLDQLIQEFKRKKERSS